MPLFSPKILLARPTGSARIKSRCWLTPDMDLEDLGTTMSAGSSISSQSASLFFNLSPLSTSSSTVFQLESLAVEKCMS